jgi:tetratricopeptide (TPR) repeat protein
MGLFMAPGVRSARAHLSGTSKVVLRRLGDREGSTISITVLKAPPQAKKAYAKGAEWMFKKNYAEARKQFRKAVEAYPECALAWSELGAAEALAGQKDEARAAFNRAIQIDGMYLKPLVQLARLEADQGRWADCARAAEMAIALKPVEFPGAYYFRALAHLNSKEWEAAARVGQQCIVADSYREFRRAYLVKAMASDELGRREEAMADLREFLRLEPPGKESAWAADYLRRLQNRPD